VSRCRAAVAVSKPPFVRQIERGHASNAIRFLGESA
jgi:hypothetical protein